MLILTAFALSTESKHSSQESIRGFSGKESGSTQRCLANLTLLMQQQQLLGIAPTQKKPTNNCSKSTDSSKPKTKTVQNKYQSSARGEINKRYKTLNNTCNSSFHTKANRENRFVPDDRRWISTLLSANCTRKYCVDQCHTRINQQETFITKR